MKKIIIILAILLVFGFAAPLFAQQESQESKESSKESKGSSSKYQESEYYYYNFTIEKIYTHRLGYMVIYRKGSSNQLGRTYIPSNWFTDIGGKGELIGLGTGSEWPSMIVYYKGGEFSHVRLRVRRDRMHETWGMIPLSVNVDENFQDIEEVKIEF